MNKIKNLNHNYRHELFILLASIPACSKNPCLNGGSCTNDKSPLGYKCSCPTGYSGDFCEKSLFHCFYFEFIKIAKKNIKQLKLNSKIKIKK